MTSERKRKKLYRAILFMLGALWLVSGILIMYVFFGARLENSGILTREGDRSNNLSLDDMLLSFSELKLGSNTTLINLQLKEVSQAVVAVPREEEKSLIVSKRKDIYNQILEQKIHTKPVEKEGGFRIKPVPE